MSVLGAVAVSRGVDPGIIVAIVMGVASIIGTGIAGYYTYKSARRNAQATREVEADKLSTASWEAQVTNWRQDVVILREQRAEDLAAYEAHRKECSQETTNLNKRLDEVMKLRDEDRREHRLERAQLESRINDLTTWGRSVVSIMKAQGIEFPAPPRGLSDTNPEGIPAQTWD